MLKGMNTNISFPYSDTLYEAKDEMDKLGAALILVKEIADDIYKRKP